MLSPCSLTLTPLAGPFDVFIRLRIFWKCFLCCFYLDVTQDEPAAIGIYQIYQRKHTVCHIASFQLFLWFH